MEEETVHVRMAEMAVVQDGTRMKAILGSCVGVVLHDSSRRLTALAHIMLPTRLSGDGATAKYADTAVPAMLEELIRRGARKKDVRAYLAGGASLFGKSEDRRLVTVGELNCAVVRDVLAKLEIEVIYDDTGGERGRTVLFDNRSGEIVVKTIRPSVNCGSTT